LGQVVAGGNIYYNSARSFNYSVNNVQDHFDLLHDAIVRCLEEGIDFYTSVCDINKSVRHENLKHERLELVKHTQKRPAGWNFRAGKYFCDLNRLLVKNNIQEGMHAMNGGEKQFGMYSVDFYIPEYEIIIEYNEASHYANKKKMSYDSNRRKYLEKITGVPVVIVHENKESVLWCLREIKRIIKLSNLKMLYA
jgi:very-short-patch-repair endonuclease